MKKKLGWFVALSVLVTVTNAADIIMSWSSNGVLKATGMEPGTPCAFEWSSDLKNGFTNGISDLEGLVANSNGAVEVAVPLVLLAGEPSTLFFRASEIATNATPVNLEGMVFVAGGTSSGTNPLVDGEYYDGGYPETYSLTVDSFYMDATEVTKARWDTIYTWAVANGYEFENVGSGKAATHPVHTVTWFDCVKWCNARSEMEGRTPCYTLNGATYKTGEPALFFDPAPVCDMDVDGYRLPTSDEWEYAARGGLDSQRFPWGDTITHSQANYYSHMHGIGDPLAASYDISPTRGFHPDYDDDDEALMPYTSPVGAFAPNAYGLYDMEGNVWEWCTTESTSVRIRRGGSWLGFARCGLELEEDPYGVSDAGGFRSVRR